VGQCTTHLIARLQTTEASNHIIQEGIIIMGKRDWVRCLFRDPRRCLKFQVLGTNHMAAEYTQPCEAHVVKNTGQWVVRRLTIGSFGAHTARQLGMCCETTCSPSLLRQAGMWGGLTAKNRFSDPTEVQ